MKLQWKSGIIGVFALFVLGELKAEQPLALTVPKLMTQSKPTTPAEAEAQLQGAITDFCYWFAYVGEFFNMSFCNPEECNTPTGFYNCLEKVAAWLDPELCVDLKSQLRPICDNACTWLFCKKSDVRQACKSVCCPLNRDNIKNCMGKGESCPFPPIKCGSALSKKRREPSQKGKSY